jgi:cytochrome d ubiquinol oxidase subunit II
VQNFWFVAIAVLWAGYFVLEGFDFGVGVLLPAVAHTDRERRLTLRTIGPIWDGNEVWLIVAGGATFAAFPEWYATMFSGFYLAFALLLVGLILRGIGIEYRGHAESGRGRSWCDGAVVVGSLLPALLLGVAFADFLRGVPMNAGHDMTGSFFSLLTPYALLGGLVTLTLFAFHGATFLVMRTDGVIAVRASRLAHVLGPVAAVLAAAFVIWTTQVRGGPLSVVVGVVLVVAVATGALAARTLRAGLAFAATALAAALVPVWTFTALFPDVLPARNGAQFSLTLHNASSSPYTLKVMTIVALIFLPIVLAYQAWAYWIFRARITGALFDGGSGPTGGGSGGGSGTAPAAGRLGGVLTKARSSAEQTLGMHSRPAPPADARRSPAPSATGPRPGLASPEVATPPDPA